MYLWNLLPNSIQGVVRLPHQKRTAFFLTGLCIFALATPQIAPVSAQSTQATVQEILDGNQVFIQNKRASINDVARQKQQVRTGNSRTALLFNTGAVARLSANSVLNIGQCARLRKGTILINGAVNACSASITTGVRGTTYLLAVDESGNQQVTVLEGEVVVKRNANPIVDEDDDQTTKPTNKPTTKPSTKTTNTKTTIKPSTSKPNVISSTTTSSKGKQFTAPVKPVLPPTNPRQQGRPVDPINGQPVNDKPILKIEQNSQSANQSDKVVLKAGEKVEVNPRGALGIIQKLTENEFVELLQGNLFKGFTSQIPGIDKVRSVFNGLFPGVNFPISIPSIPTPSIPIPSIPRFPF